MAKKGRNKGNVRAVVMMLSLVALLITRLIPGDVMTVIYTLICAGIILWSWLPASKILLPEKIVITWSVAALGVASFLSYRWLMIIYILLSFIVVLYLILRFAYFKNEDLDISVLALEAVYLWLNLIILAIKYSFVSFPWLFLGITLGVSAGICLLFFLAFRTADWRKKRDLVWSVILVFFMVAVSVFCFVCHLNYALDFNGAAEQKWAVIVDKDINFGGSRGVTTYEFELVLDGEEVDLKVSRSEYRHYEIGDHYPVNFYNGAFNVPFYLSGNHDYE